MAKAKNVGHGGRVSRPAVLKPGHDLAPFDCGRDQITDWLKQRARKAAESDTARTYVVCRGTRRVVGFFSMAAGAVAHADVSAKFRQNTPDPIPVILLARLGVDLSEKGRGLGQSLLADAMKRALQSAELVAARALLIHALDADAAKFYEGLGLKRLKGSEDITFYIRMSEIRASLP